MDSLNESFSKLDASVDAGPTVDRCPVKVNPPPSRSVESYKIPKTLHEANLDLLESKRYTDVTFIVGWLRSRFPCHKLILIARSSEFARLFAPRDHGGKELKEYEIPDTTSSTFELFLKFVYADSFVGVTTMQATDLLHLACKFKVELLEDHCITHLVENVKLSDAPKVFGVANRRRLTDLRDLALDIMAKEFKDLLSSTEFLGLDRGMQEIILKMLLARDDLPGSEMDIFNHVVRWGKRTIVDYDANMEKLKNNLASVLPLIRFPTMTIFEFANSIVPMNVLNQDIVINIFTYLAASGLVRSEYATKLKDLHCSTTPRNLTVSTGSVSKSVRFHCDTPTLTVPYYICAWGPLLEKLRFRVLIKSEAEFAKNPDRLLLIRIILKLPEVVSTQKIISIAEQTEDNNIQVVIRELGSSCEKGVIFKKRVAYVERETLEVLISPPVQLSDGFDYCIDVEEASGPISQYTCRLYGELKSLVWFKGSNSLVKLRDIKYDSQISRKPEAGIIYGLQFRSEQPNLENFSIDADAFREKVNFESSCGQALTGLIKSKPASKTSASGSPGCTNSTSGSPACTTSTSEASTGTTTWIFEPPPTTTAPVLGSAPCTAKSAFDSPTSLTSAFGTPTSKTASTLGSPISTTASVFGSQACTTPIFCFLSRPTPPLFGSLASTVTPPVANTESRSDESKI